MGQLSSDTRRLPAYCGGIRHRAGRTFRDPQPPPPVTRGDRAVSRRRLERDVARLSSRWPVLLSGFAPRLRSACAPPPIPIASLHAPSLGTEDADITCSMAVLALIEHDTAAALETGGAPGSSMRASPASALAIATSCNCSRSVVWRARSTNCADVIPRATTCSPSTSPTCEALQPLGTVRRLRRGATPGVQHYRTAATHALLGEPHHRDRGRARRARHRRPGMFLAHQSAARRAVRMYQLDTAARHLDRCLALWPRSTVLQFHGASRAPQWQPRQCRTAPRNRREANPAFTGCPVGAATPPSPAR